MTPQAEYRQDHLIKLIREIQLLQKLSNAKANQFTVRLLDLFVNPEAKADPKQLKIIYLVMEYIPTSLQSLIESGFTLEVEQAKVLMYNLALALKYLHSAKVMHRDLKPANILINDDCTVKICDFGLSRGMFLPPKPSKTKQRAARPLSPVCATRFYRAPEIMLQQGHYDGGIDMWSFGCISSEICKKTIDETRAKALFKGKTCYPISPRQSNELTEGCPIDSQD